jgi:hypothetical protein
MGQAPSLLRVAFDDDEDEDDDDEGGGAMSGS